MRNATTFQRTVWDYYNAHGRHDLPWRRLKTSGTIDPYRVLVSEVMLQQTQVPRVVPKFNHFLEKFPDIETLGMTPLGEVLACWSGLGYNRRAKFLWQAAGEIVRKYDGDVPANLAELITLPGIGPNTAGAILTYAFNQRQVFIETNIRTVFIHHFFADEQHVADSAIAAQVAATLPVDNCRLWYWALMDYGTYLKQTVGNVARQSRGFVKQSRFEGSRRQIRGRVLKILAEEAQTKAQLIVHIADDRLPNVLDDLTQEGLIICAERTYMLPRV